MTTMDQIMTQEDEGKVKFKDYDGKVFKVECKDPYGFWHITPMKGQTPKELSGVYTSYGIAKRDLDSYMQKQTKEVKNG